MLRCPPRVGTPWMRSSRPPSRTARPCAARPGSGGGRGGACYTAVVASGATVRAEPGVWTQSSERYYATFVNDLHQNNVEAVWHAPEPVVDAPRRPGVSRFLT